MVSIYFFPLRIRLLATPYLENTHECQQAQNGPSNKESHSHKNCQNHFQKLGQCPQDKAHYSASTHWILQAHHPGSPLLQLERDTGWVLALECSSCTVCRNGTALQTQDPRKTSRLQVSKTSWWMRRWVRTRTCTQSREEGPSEAHQM